MRLTKKACEELARLPAEAAKGRPVHWDDALPGFGVRLNSPGSLSFIVKFRVKGDPRQRKVTLGDFPAMTVEAARDEAARIKTAARLGRDLPAERLAAARQAAEARALAEAARVQAARQAVPVTDLLDGWRQAAEAAMAAKAEAGESVLYERELLRLEARRLRPEVGGATVGDFDPERLQALIHREASLSTARNLRNLLVRVARHVNAEMVGRGLPVRWPTRFEVAGSPRYRSHRYTLGEVARLWIGAGTLGRRGAMLRFMLLTGCRRIEAQRVEWSHIRLDDPVLGAHWLQPGERTKNHLPHRVPLSPPAVALLRWLPPRETKTSGRAPLIFAGRGNKAVGGWTDVRAALLRAAEVDAGTLHDFRRTMVSALGDHGFDPQVADSLLNHAASTTMGGVMGVYQRSDLWLKRREAMDLWADLVMQAVGEAQGKPVCRETWGFTAPFEDARIRRPRKPKAGAEPGREKRKRRRPGAPVQPTAGVVS